MNRHLIGQKAKCRLPGPTGIIYDIKSKTALEVSELTLLSIGYAKTSGTQ